MTKTVFLLALILLTSSCSDDTPTRTDLSALRSAQTDFHGRDIIVSGTLRSFPDPLHYWIENDALDRVALESERDLAQWVGEIVEVRGTFYYGRKSGRRIYVRELGRPVRD